MIAIIDYGAGNLGSVTNAFRHIGVDVEVTHDPMRVRSAQAVVLPGVGAFCHCMEGLQEAGLTSVVKDVVKVGRPFLGICVGMQMLFEESEEPGDRRGLGVIPGKVVRFDPKANGPDNRHGVLKVPHIGWNDLTFKADSPLYRGLDQGARVYFVHSYYPVPNDFTITNATTNYGGAFCASIEINQVFATQFHPEKSGTVGLTILRNFASLVS